MADVQKIGQYLQKELLRPYTYLLHVAGKQFRTKIVLAFNHWLKVPEDRVQNAVDIMTTLHNGSLLIDDIQDNSTSRRGQPAAHCIYGLPLTLNTSIQVIAMALQKALQLMPKEEGCYIFAEQFQDIAIGQGSEIYWRDHFICPTEEEYKKMIEQKTGGMLLLGVKLIQAFSENKENYDDFVKFLGYYYQVRDDYCNLRKQEALEEWPVAEDVDKSEASNFCEDITEGKFSLPVIHAMKTAEGRQILNILRQRTRDMKLKKYCLYLLEKSGSVQYTRDFLSELDRKARTELTRLGGNPLMETVLDGLLSWKN